MDTKKVKGQKKQGTYAAHASRYSHGMAKSVRAGLRMAGTREDREVQGSAQEAAECGEMIMV
jgi:hypothetical protein